MFRAYKFRLIPNKQQEELLNKWEGSTRWVWNHFLDLEQKEYDATKKFIWKFDLHKTIPILKQQHSWLTEVPSQTLQQIGTSMHKAIRDAVKHSKGFPKFKKKNVRNGQILIPNQIINGKNHAVKPTPTHIQLPKIGKVKWKQHRDLPNGKIKQAQITKDIDQWYVSILLELPDVIPMPIDPGNCKSIGIDLGISSFLIDSNGNKVPSPKFLKQKEQRLKRYQRQYSRKKKGSNNSKKARIKLAKYHREIRNSRADWLNKLSNNIVSNYDVICAEDLKTKSLVEGKNQKSLNRAISDQGWGMFLNMIRYKCDHSGKTFTQLDPYAATSKTCSRCSHKLEKLELDMRNWICPSCNAEHDRDINAAINIHFWGLTITRNNISTAGTAGIHACGVSHQPIDHIDRDTINQEADCPLGQQ